MKTSSRSSKRKRKHSQKRSKKKSRSSREKIKKLKRRDYSDDEDSMSYSSRGDDDGKSKRGRSRDRKSKRDKKRSKRTSLVNESSGDDLPRVKKSKRLRKGRSLDDKKKRRGKKRRRDRSVSSVSSPSRSDSGSERSDDSGISERKVEEVEIEERKGREKKRSGSVSVSVSRRRSKSFSPCSLHSEEVSSPKRLKSVIVVMKESDVIEEQESNRDDRHEDEIDCEFDDDYPSKSNDSIDGVSGREAIPNIHDVSSKERLLDEPNKEFFASDVKISEGLGIQRQGVEGSEGMTPRSTINEPPIGSISEICTGSAGSGRADLEANLRQKALENLLKRKGKFSAKIPGDNEGGCDIEVKKPSIVGAQHIYQNMLHEGNINSVKNVGKGNDDHKLHDDENIKYVQNVGKDVDDKHMPCYDGNIKSEQMVGRVVDVRNTTRLPSHSIDETGPSTYRNAHIPNMNDKIARLAGKGKVSGNSFSGRPNVSLSMSRNEFLGRKNTWKRQLIPTKDCEENLSAPREFIAKDPTQQVVLREGTEPTLSTPQETVSEESIRDSSSQQFDTKISSEKVEADGSSDPSPFGGQRMTDKTSETDEENQFQQKTMSVMRGGEMVQVSYKVYIPKTAPALTRRKLKR